jgi:hypothetical protein
MTLMLESAVDHMLDNVLPAGVDYISAENALSLAYEASSASADWAAEARLANRRAAELAIPIDGLLTVVNRTSDFRSLKFVPLSRCFAYTQERVHLALAVSNGFEGSRMLTSTKISPTRRFPSHPTPTFSLWG